jgi:flagellar hook-associated protein 1
VADLFALLVQSGNSLQAHSAAVATAGNNVANANTPGYTRQIVDLVANPAVGLIGAQAVGQGVSVGAITQARDAFVERQVPQTLAASGRSQAESDALTSMSALDPSLPGGLSSTVSQFYTALGTLSQNPGDLSLRQNAVSTASNLAQSFNQTASTIESTRDGIDSKITGDLSVINSTAHDLADLNGQIQKTTAAGGDVNDLLDARRNAADKLSTLTGATPYTDEAGDTLMALPGGLALVTGNSASTLSALPDATNGNHVRILITKADGSGPNALPTAALGGEVGGLLDARDGALKTAVDSVDGFAFDLATSLNTLNAAGYAMDGSTGNTLFTIPATSVGAASQIAVNPAVQADPRLLAAATTLPAASGDNRNILAMIGTQSQALAGGNNPVATIQKITGDFGTSSANATATAAHDAAMAQNLTDLRNSTSGVSIDDEMINLTKAQAAYQAVSKVITTANDMLTTLMAMGIVTQ